MRVATFTRIPPGTTEYIGCLERVTDPLSAVATKRESISLHGADAIPVKIAHACATPTDVGKVYPYDGTTGALPATPASHGGTILKLPSGCLPGASDPLSPIGLLALVRLAGGGAVTRLLTGWQTPPGTDRIATVHRAWDSGEGVPAESDVVRLLVPLDLVADLTIKAEYSSGTNVASVLPLLYGWPQTAHPSSPTSAHPVIVPDQVVELANLNVQYDVSDASAYHAQPWTCRTKGFVGAKVRLVALDAGTVSLWAATT